MVNDLLDDLRILKGAAMRQLSISRGVGSAVLALALGLAGAAEAANDIGVTSASVQPVRGTPPQQASRVLQIGVDVQANERVQTDAGGRAHLLFVDGSALSIGPDSDVVLDEFVYDASSKTGKLAFSATKGVFRLVGGKISKQDEVLLRTPTATIGVRGGVVMASVGPGQVDADFLFGASLTVTGGGGQQTANRPGSRISQVGNGRPLPPVPTVPRFGRTPCWA